MKEIKLEHGCKIKIAKIFNVSQPTLRKALRYQKVENEILARKIRNAAIKQFGGVELSENKKQIYKL